MSLNNSGNVHILGKFDTKKLLNRKASVAISKTSGLAGIAYWINDNYSLEGEASVDKKSPLVVSLKAWIDEEYENGRQSMLSTMEIERKIEELSGGQFKRL